MRWRRSSPSDLRAGSTRSCAGSPGEAAAVVEAVGLVTEQPEKIDAVLITRHLDYSLPVPRALLRARDSQLRTHLLERSRRAACAPAPAWVLLG